MLFQECVSNAFQELLRFQIFMLYLLNYAYQNDDFGECSSLLGLLLDQIFSWLLTPVSDSLLSLFSMTQSPHAFFFFNYLVHVCVYVCVHVHVCAQAHTHTKAILLGLHSLFWLMILPPSFLIRSPKYLSSWIPTYVKCLFWKLQQHLCWKHILVKGSEFQTALLQPKGNLWKLEHMSIEKHSRNHAKASIYSHEDLGQS